MVLIEPAAMRSVISGSELLRIQPAIHRTYFFVDHRTQPLDEGGRDIRGNGFDR